MSDVSENISMNNLAILDRGSVSDLRSPEDRCADSEFGIKPIKEKKVFSQDRLDKLAKARERAYIVRMENKKRRMQAEIEKMDQHDKVPEKDDDIVPDIVPTCDRVAIEPAPCTPPLAGCTPPMVVKQKTKGKKKMVVVEQSSDDSDEFEDTRNVIFIKRARKKKEVAPKPPPSPPKPPPSPPTQPSPPCDRRHSQMQQFYNDMFSGNNIMMTNRRRF